MLKYYLTRASEWILEDVHTLVKPVSFVGWVPEKNFRHTYLRTILAQNLLGNNIIPAFAKGIFLTKIMSHYQYY